MARMISYREQAAKAYKTFPFALSMALAEIPYSVICAVGFFIPIYYLPGLQPGSDRAGYFFLMVLITEFFSVSLGQMIAALTASPLYAILCNPFCIIVFALFQGVTITQDQMPAFWRAWLYQLDPFTRLISGTVTTALHGLQVRCHPHELNAFKAPPNETCGTYMQAFFDAGGAGYLVKAGLAFFIGQGEFLVAGHALELL